MARFEHENKVRRKELKPEKNGIHLFLESGIQYPGSGIHSIWNPESKTVLDSLTWGDCYLFFLT